MHATNLYGAMLAVWYRQHAGACLHDDLPARVHVTFAASQVCSACSVGQVQAAACSAGRDTQCQGCNASSKPANSIWTTPGSCAWRCNAGYLLETREQSCIEALAVLPEALLPDERVPSVAVQLKLAMSKLEFEVRP